MRLGAKSMPSMAGGYCPLIGALGIDSWLRTFEDEVALPTASLLAWETAVLPSERTSAALIAPEVKALSCASACKTFHW